MKDRVRRHLQRLMCALVGCAGLPVSLAAAPGPSITDFRPLGLPPAASSVLRFHGQQLDGARLWTSASPDSVLLNAEGSCRWTAPDPAQPALVTLRLTGPGGCSELRFLLIDPLPSMSASGTNTTPGRALRITAPVAIDADAVERASLYYRFHAPAGTAITIEAVAARIGSEMDPVLRILDLAGRELCHDEDGAGDGADARVEFRPPQAGDFLIEIRDTRFQGGRRFFHRLRLGARALDHPRLLWTGGNGPAPVTEAVTVSEQEPNDDATQANAMAWPGRLAGRLDREHDRDIFRFDAGRGDRLTFTGYSRQIGSACDLFFQILNADGTWVADANVAGADDGTLTHRFANAGPFLLLVEELNLRGAPGFAYRIDVARTEPGFSLATDAEQVVAEAGGQVELKVTASRRDFDGPIELHPAGALPAGLSFATNAVISRPSTSATLSLAVSRALAPGTLLLLRLEGRAEHGERTLTAPVQTVATLRKRFPRMRHPPDGLNGLVAIAVTEPARKSSANP